jgi:hypothetical protein
MSAVKMASPIVASGLHKRVMFCLCSHMLKDVFIAGVPFMPLFHHDGRMMRAGGLFAFARRDGRRRLILHMEFAEAINRRAICGHPRWEWVISQGLNELLVSFASSAAASEREDDDPEVSWHTEAEFWPADKPDYWPASLEGPILPVSLVRRPSR